MKSKYRQIINSIPDAAIQYEPSAYAEKFRTLTSDVSTIQGRFKYSLTPYLKEIVDTLSPYHPAKLVAVMKGAQIGYTEGVIVNGILWIIANNPGNIMLLSANDTLSQEVVESRIDQGLASCGIQHLIRPNTIRKRNARTGDTSKYKEFAGGRLFAGGMQSVDKLGKQRSIKYGFFDDWDAAPLSDAKQGSIFDILQQRFATAANSMKQYYISTPETTPSNIENVYLRGDQRKWQLPCPKCNEFIEIKWGQIKYKKTKTGRLEAGTVAYECQKCSQHFTEKHKYKMNLNGVWVPTAEPEEPGWYSYHITALTAAPHMYNWDYYARKWLDIHKDGTVKVSKLKPFKNLVLGEPWQEKQTEVKRNILSRNTRSYSVSTVPSQKAISDGSGEIVLLTCACDIGGTLEDGRLDYEVVGWATNGSTYSIDAGSIGSHGSRDKERTKWSYSHEKEDNIWDFFWSEILDRDYITSDGEIMKIFMAGIDTGYLDQKCWQFINQHPDRLIGLKGESSEKYIKVAVDLPLFKVSRERKNLFIIQVDKIKDIIAENVALKWENGTDQPAGFMNFPQPTDGKYTVRGYFSQYETEKKVVQENEEGEVVGYKWTRKHSHAPNHFFDVCVYNHAVRNIVVDKVCKELKIKTPTWEGFVNIINSL